MENHETYYENLKNKFNALAPGAHNRQALLVSMARHLRKMEAKHESLRKGEKSGPFQKLYFDSLKKNSGAQG